MLEGSAEPAITTHELIGTQAIQQDPDIACVRYRVGMSIGADLPHTSCCEVQGHSEALCERETKPPQGREDARTKSITVRLGCMIASTTGRAA